MSQGVPIRFRRTTRNSPQDTKYVGQGFYHLPDSKLGIYDGAHMCWYPGIDPLKNMMTMNEAQKLGGKAPDGSLSPVAFSFQSSALRVVNINDDSVIAAFNASGGVSLSGATVAGVLPGGSLSKSSHPGFLPQFFDTEYSSDSFEGLIGPNTYMWKVTGNSGEFSAAYGYKEGLGDTTHFSAELFSLKCSVSATLSGMGLRTWLFDPTIHSINNENGILIDNDHKVFLSYYGPRGQANTFRIGRDGSYTSVTVQGADKWVRIALDVPVLEKDETFVYSTGKSPIAVDLLYNTTGGDWYFGEINVQNTYYNPSEVHQYRSMSERCAIGDALYRKYKDVYFSGGNAKYFNANLNVPVLHTRASTTFKVISSDRPVTLLSQAADGFSAYSTDATSGNWKATLVFGYRGSPSDI